MIKGIKTNNFKLINYKTMKTQTNLFSQISKATVKNLTMEIKETLAFGYTNNSQSKTFSSAELWNIQRQRRSLGSRRGFAF